MHGQQVLVMLRKERLGFDGTVAALDDAVKSQAAQLQTAQAAQRTAQAAKEAAKQVRMVIAVVNGSDIHVIFCFIMHMFDGTYHHSTCITRHFPWPAVLCNCTPLHQPGMVKPCARSMDR